MMQTTEALSPMLHIKEATKVWHDKLEEHAQSHKIMNLSISLEEYQNLLEFHYLLHDALEPVVTAIIEEHWPELEFAKKRCKLPALKKDLTALTVNTQKQYSASFVNCPASALGAAYVLEGSTLGGQVILRQLQKIPEIAETSAFHYYGLYGDQVGKRWKQFKSLANQALEDKIAQEKAQSAAISTFQLACQIFQDRQAHAA